MPSKILKEYINKNPQGFDIVAKALNYLENFISEQKISKQDFQNQILLAENLTKDNPPIFTAAVLVHKILNDQPERQKELKELLGKEGLQLIMALNIANKYYKNITEPSGRLYLDHTIGTARILGRMKLDTTTIVAGLLHHFSHVTSQSLSLIENQLGSTAVTLLSQYLKINHITNKTKSFNSNVREILLAVAQDVRVIFIKMASTIDALKHHEDIPVDDKYLVAKQAKEILAPIADMLGAWHLRWQLEDYSFRILQKKGYEKIAKKFGQEGRKLRDKYINKVQKHILKEAQKKNIDCEINGRFKHYYSIYQKMKTKQRTFNEIYDVFALRVTVKTIDDCYLMLRIIHGLWQPINKRIKDYIASPKANGYQTLHTTVIGPDNRLTEFQIRTQEMHLQALYGVAAQCYYKNQDLDSTWTRKILKTNRLFAHKDVWEEELSKIFQEKIYVYTPKGDVISLPRGATPIDFAYQIHTELGHFCKFAIVNNQPVELNKKLKNEDVVEIIPDINSEGPDPAWLKFIKTPLAKKHIEKFNKQKNLL